MLSRGCAVLVEPGENALILISWVRGDVHGVSFTCINWLRTPYVRAWAARYSEQGLVVIGVHTPEFTFEEDIDNVRKAAQERRLTYPIAIDNNRAI